MKDVHSALVDFVRLFERLQLSYAVMGGLAVRVYAIPRPTYDVDLTLAVARDDLPALYQSVRNLGYTVRDVYDTGWVDTVAGMPIVKFRYYLVGHGIDIDIFLAECPFQKELLTRRRLLDLDGEPVWLVSPEDLILLKLVANRPRDIADITDVLFTQGQLDDSYLKKWAAKLGTLEALEKVLRNADLGG